MGNCLHPKDLEAAIWPLKLISALMGLVATRRSFIRAAYNILLITVLLSCVIIELISRTSRIYSASSKILTITRVFEWLSLVATTLASILLNIRAREIYIIIKKFSIVDELLIEEPQKFYRRIVFIQMAQIVFISFALALAYSYCCWVGIGRFSETSLYYSITFICYSICFTMNVQYVDLVALLVSRFKILNQKLDIQVNVDSLKLACQRGTSATCVCLPISSQRSNKITTRSVNGTYETNDEAISETRLPTSDDIGMMSKVHDILSDIACSINSMFTVQTLLDMQATFVNVLIILYHGITSTPENTPHLRQEHVFGMTMSWALVSFLKVLMTTAACHFASAEASHTACCLQKMILWQPMGEEQSRRAVTFLRQTVNNRVKFTACGLFNIDLCFFLSFVGSISTYLVVLLQFN